MQESIRPGDLVIPDSFLDRTIKRSGTFYDGKSEYYRGKEKQTFLLTKFKRNKLTTIILYFAGVCHIPMEPAFNSEVRKIIGIAAKNLDIEIKNGGNVVTIEGPRFSSKMESLAFQKLGGDLVNMTICPEVENFHYLFNIIFIIIVL